MCRLCCGDWEFEEEVTINDLPFDALGLIIDFLGRKNHSIDSFLLASPDLADAYCARFQTIINSNFTWLLSHPLHLGVYRYGPRSALHARREDNGVCIYKVELLSSKSIPYQWHQTSLGDCNDIYQMLENTARKIDNELYLRAYNPDEKIDIKQALVMPAAMLESMKD